MATSAQLLGQQAVEDRIVQHLHDSNRFVWMRGPSGSGKSVIADHVSAWWKDREGDSITVLGDREQRDIPLYPLYRALRGWRLAPRIRDFVKREGVAPLRDLPFVGNTLAFLVGLLGTAATAAPRFLTDNEANLLSELQSHSIMEATFLIVVDNVHWVDCQGRSKSDSCALLVNLSCYFAGRVSWGRTEPSSGMRGDDYGTTDVVAR